MERLSYLISLIGQSSEIHHIEYSMRGSDRIFLSNHLSQALIALYGLGADNNRMKSFYDAYERGDGHLGPLMNTVPTQHKITKENFVQHLGNSLYGTNSHTDQSYYTSYRAYFRERLHAQETTSTTLLREFLPQLLPGISGAAFHPIIHVGWALSLPGVPVLDTMLTDGLSYMAFAYFDLGNVVVHNEAKVSNGEGKQYMPLPEIVQSVSDGELVKNYLKGEHEEGFQHRLTKIRSNKSLSAFLNECTLHWDTSDPGMSVDALYEELLLLVLDLHYQTKSSHFFVLHLMTSCYGVKFILSVLEEDQQRELLRYYFRALLFAFVAVGAPSILPFRKNADQGVKAGKVQWDQVEREGTTEFRRTSYQGRVCALRD
jgi:hypothetical protein